MYYVLFVVLVVTTFLSNRTQAEQAFESIQTPFIFGKMVDHTTKSTQNVTFCLVSTDPASGKITVQTQDMIFNMTQPQSMPAANGIISVKDTSGEHLLELNYDTMEQTLRFFAKDKNQQLLISLECHFAQLRN